ncbi:hypothetical protein PT2222_420044 [Paraburkholderia tropica]
MSEAFRLHFLPTKALRTGLRPAFRPLRADLCHQSLAREIDVGQGQRNEGAIGVLRQTAIAHLREAPQALDDSKHVLNPSTDLRLVAILAARYLVNFARTARTLIGEVTCLGGLVTDQRFLARIGAISIDALLLPMQQFRQRMFVVDVGRRDHRAMCQAALTIDPDVQLHAEIPLLAFARLMHLRVARLLLVLGRAGGGDQRRVHDGAARKLHTAGLQHPPHLGEEPLTQLVLLKQAPEFEQRCRIRYGFAAQINAHKATQAGAVIQSLFASEVGQIEPVLHEVNPQHALQTNRRATVAAFRVIRFDYRTQFGPRNDGVHRVKKLVASRAFASGLEPRTLIRGHRERLLLHCLLPFSLLVRSITLDAHKRWT